MDGEIIGLVAVIISLGIPLGGMYTYYRVRKLRSEERLAAISRGVDIPAEPETTQAVRSRRWGNPLGNGAPCFILPLGLIPQIGHEPGSWAAAALSMVVIAD